MTLRLKQYSFSLIFLLILLAPIVSIAGEALVTRYFESSKGEIHYNVIRSVQAALKGAGYDPGPIDGDAGQKTTTALIKYQKENGLIADGIIGSQTLNSLGIAQKTKRRSRMSLEDRLKNRLN